MTLGQRLKSARLARGMTQRALAAGVVLSESFISMLEHDKVRPSLQTLKMLAEHLQRPLEYFTGGVQHAAEPAEVAIQEGEGFLRRHQFTQALEAFSAAAPVVEAGRDTRLRVRCLLGLGQALTAIRQMDLAELHLRNAWKLAEARGYTDLLASAANALGIWTFRSRRFVEARTIYEDGIDRLRTCGMEDTEIMGKLLVNLGRAHVELGLPAQALESFQLAAGKLQRAADPTYLGLLEFNIGVAYRQQEAFELAQRHLERALDLFTLQENLQLLSVVNRSMGILKCERGELQDAVVLLKHSLRLARQVADDEGIAHSLLWLARGWMKQGLTERARHAAEEAATLASSISDRAAIALVEAVSAEIASTEGRMDEAIVRFESAIAMFEGLSMTDDLARACRDLGFVLMKRGKAAAAAERFAKAFELQRASTPKKEETSSP